MAISLFKRLFPNETLVVDDVPHQEPEQEPEPTNLASELKEFLKRDQEVKNIVIYHQNTKYSYKKSSFCSRGKIIFLAREF